MSTSFDISSGLLCAFFGGLTGLVEHLIALIENEVLEVGKAKLLVTDKSVNATGCTDDDVRVRVLVREDIDILLDWSTAIEDGYSNIREELREAVVLILDLVSQLTGVAHDQDRGRSGLRLFIHLLQCSEDEDGCLS